MMIHNKFTQTLIDITTHYSNLSIILHNR